MRHWPPHTDLVREDPKGGGGSRSDPVRSGLEGGRSVRSGPDPSPVGRRLPGADEDVAPPIGVRLTSWGQRGLRARRGGVSLPRYHDGEQRLKAAEVGGQDAVDQENAHRGSQRRKPRPRTIARTSPATVSISSRRRSTAE